MLCMTGLERIVILLCGKERLHTFYLKLHFDAGSEASDHIGQGYTDLVICIHSSTDGSKQMGVIRCYNVFCIQIQGADKGAAQLRKEV